MKQSLLSLLIVIGLTSNFLASADEPAPKPSAAKAEQQEEVLNNAAIIELKQLGVGENLIIEKIKISRCAFDVSINGLKQLKAANVPESILSAMLSARSGTPLAAGNGAVEQLADSNDPKAPHEAGIWLYEESDGKGKMTQLEPSVYSQNRTGVAIFAQFGQSAKSEAMIRSAHAEIQTTNRKPAFYFYFEKKESGLSQNQNIATSPNEYILSQFEVSEPDNQRRLVMGLMNAYSGGESGAEGRSIRSFSFQKLSPGIYKVTPKEDLANGEYGFFYGGNNMGGKVFDFGIKGSAETEPAAPVVQNAPESKSKIKNLLKKKTGS